MYKLSQLLRPTPPDDLLSSRLYDEQTFYADFVKDLKHSQERVIIESPYLTCRRVRQIAPVLAKLTKRGVKITVNTRNPQHHDEYLRMQAYMAIKQLNAAGVDVNAYSNYHHRKIAIIDSSILWEGSLNILSQNNSCEIMRRITSPELAKQMLHFLKLNKRSV